MQPPQLSDTACNFGVADSVPSSTRVLLSALPPAPNRSTQRPCWCPLRAPTSSRELLAALPTAPNSPGQLLAALPADLNSSWEVLAVLPTTPTSSLELLPNSSWKLFVLCKQPPAAVGSCRRLVNSSQQRLGPVGLGGNSPDLLGAAGRAQATAAFALPSTPSSHASSAQQFCQRLRTSRGSCGQFCEQPPAALEFFGWQLCGSCRPC